jgi:hypothetical protein
MKMVMRIGAGGRHFKQVIDLENGLGDDEP